MTEILEIFSLLLNTDKFQKCQTDNKKSSKSFSDLLLSLIAGGRLVFNFERLDKGGSVKLGFCRHQKSKFITDIIVPASHSA